MVEVIKLYIKWHQQQLPFASFLQAHKRRVGIKGEKMPYNSFTINYPVRAHVISAANTSQIIKYGILR